MQFLGELPIGRFDRCLARAARDAQGGVGISHCRQHILCIKKPFASYVAKGAGSFKRGKAVSTWLCEGRTAPRMTDPFLLFDAWYAEARETEINDSNAMALATADARGRPSLRKIGRASCRDRVWQDV